MEYVLLILGFILIIVSSDILVDSASSIAYRFKLSKMLVALTIVAFGTCAPELAISFQSVSSNNGSMALANVVGSCISNVFLIIGLAAFINPLRIKLQTIKKELPILVIITLGFVSILTESLFWITSENALTRIDGIILVLLFSLFVYYIISIVRKNDDEQDETIPKYGPVKSIIYFILSVIVIILSSNLIVDNAVIIANNLNVSEKVITLFVIVLGTSLPELTMTIMAARKGEFDIAVGNIIGTNIFNICVVLGLPIAIFGNLNVVGFNFIDMIFVFLSSFLLFLFARSEKKVSKVEGIIMILIFLAYYIYVALI